MNSDTHVPVWVWQTECAMLIELWERLRGYNKWIETEAKVESSQVKETQHSDDGIDYSTYDSNDVLVWADQQGENQRAYFKVPDDSPLYQLVGGETITIRYNPAEPDQYYLRELVETRIHTGVKRVIIPLVLICFYLVFAWLGARQGSH
jgi:hypothetical protein